MEALCGSAVRSNASLFLNARISESSKVHNIAKLNLKPRELPFCKENSKQRSNVIYRSLGPVKTLSATTSDADVKESDKTVDQAKRLSVLVESEKGISYDTLEKNLAEGLWEEADNETRRLICVLAGDEAAKRKWVYFTEVQFIPGKDLLTIDRLWRAYSNDRFGFSIQRRLWNNLQQRWKPFFLKIGWTFGENSTYKKFPMDYTWDIEAPVGHLPLTNALRGTLLLQKILTHPSFAVFDTDEFLPETTQEIPTLRNSSPTAPASPAPISIFDEGFNSSDYGF